MPAPDDVPQSLPLARWLAELAEAQGNPGGGSAAGLLLAIAAALVHMVCDYTSDDPVALALSARSARLRERALEAGRADGSVSKRLGEALAAPAGDERERMLRPAAIEATVSSADLARIALELAEVMTATAEVGARPLIADTVVAAEALSAGLGACLTNIRAGSHLARTHGADDPRLDAADELAVVVDAERLRMRELADRLRPA